MSIVLDGTTGITTPGLTNTGSETVVNLTTTGNTILGDASTDTLNVGNGGLIKDASGNVGVGVTPSASWLTLYSNKAIQFGPVGSINSLSASTTNNQTFFSSNVIDTGSNVYTRINADWVTRYTQYLGRHSWQTSTTQTGAVTLVDNMTLDASGNLGIGTTSPQATIVAAGSNATVYKAMILRNGNGTDGSSATIDFETSGGTQGSEAAMAGRIAGLRIGSGTSGALTFSTTNAGVLGERARIDSSGNLLVGTTTALGTLTVNGTVSSSYTGFYIGEQTYRMQVASGQIQVIASSGGVYLPSGGTGWGSLSDENLKNITGLITNGIDAVKSLRAARYTWKSDETNKPQVGLIAQDIRAVLPEAVDENSDGFLGVRYSDVIPLLVAAIQEQQALITQLTDRITALENK